MAADTPLDPARFNKQLPRLNLERETEGSNSLGSGNVIERLPSFSHFFDRCCRVSLIVLDDIDDLYVLGCCATSDLYVRGLIRSLSNGLRQLIKDSLKKSLW